MRRSTAEVMRRRRRARGEPGGAPSFYVAPVGNEPSDYGPSVPDLLHAEPRAWGDLRGTSELVRFAFEGGDCEGVFDTLLEAVPLAGSSLDRPADKSARDKAAPDATAVTQQLYLEELAKHCFRIVIDGDRLEPNLRAQRRILSTPPPKAEDREVRQEILRELVEQPSFRGDLETTYKALRRLRETLEMATGTEPNIVRRKVGVLVALRRVVIAMSEGFEGATSKLAALRDRGTRIRESEEFQRLSELVDAEGNLATVDLQLRLGSDGTVRDFGVLAIQERPSPLLPGPIGRFFQRMTSFFRGYRYGESEVVVRLLEEVFAPLTDHVVALLASTAAIEIYLAALGFRDLARHKGLEVCLPSFGSERREITGLFNPLLFLQDVVPVPCDVPAPRPDALVVITGPNSGGKTRLLQAIALTQLLGQGGLFVPAKRATLVPAPSMFLSLVVEGEAAQVEGRLGTELLRIRELFEKLEPGSMALLDELCSGTNPTEGEAIFEMVVGLLPKLGPQVFVSTHFLSLAARLEKEPVHPSLTFLQVELDRDEKPTFQFVSGVATTSLAHKVAARLGVTEEALAALVASKIKA
ncbi:MAG: DNA mismatch repair protein [Deltaproteobacteria bacterium]|nr:DNA mismatch repair protein [Deltaproteobacteria bacterium]